MDKLLYSMLVATGTKASLKTTRNTAKARFTGLTLSVILSSKTKSGLTVLSKSEI